MNAEPAVVIERHVEAPAVRLFALDRNPEGTPPLLFIHGWLDHGRGFDPLIAKLPQTFRTIALDLRGHGRSGHAPGGLYHVTDYLADVDFLLDALGLESVHLVGHSLGGTVALLYAAARPERVRSLTSIESLGPSGGEPEAAVDRLRRFLRDLHKPALKRVYANVDEAAAKLRANNSGLSEEAALLFARHGTEPVSAPGGTDGGGSGVRFTFDPAHRRAFGMAFDEAQTLALFRAISCPVQVIHGTHGYSLDDAQMLARLQALRADPPIAVPGSHHVHLDSPEEVARHVAAFVTRV